MRYSPRLTAYFLFLFVFLFSVAATTNAQTEREANNDFASANLIAFTGEASGSVMAKLDQVPLPGLWNFVAEQSIYRQIDTITISLSDKLQNSKGWLHAVTFTSNGVELATSGLSYRTLNDSTIEVSGLRNISNEPGTYWLAADLKQFSKFSTGQTGNGFASVRWTVMSANRAPVANAGKDTIITKAGFVTLDGSATYDPGSDPITYTIKLLKM